MEMIQMSSIRNQLHLRKEKLNNAVKEMPGKGNLISLLQQVDTALEKIDHGTYGICDVCHETVEEERLLMDPLISVCLGCMDKVQQRALENDLEFAAKIQRNLLPKNDVTISGWEFSYHYNPAGAVSGDFTDVITLNDGSVIFLIGDVSGKGIPASLMMSQLHALIRTLLTFGLSVNEIVDKANRLFCESTLYSNYATMVLGKASSDGDIEITVAGHNPPLLVHKDNVQRITGTGVPVGLFCESEYGLKHYHLDKGDSLVLYTDGLTESEVNEIEYGEERLIEQLKLSNGNAAKLVVQNLIKDQKDYLTDTKPLDDVTVLVMKRK